MWIICCGMPRSASTLQYQLASEMVEKKRLGTRVTWYKPSEHAKMIEQYRHYDGFKVCKSHQYTKPLAELLNKNQAKGLYIYRDLRDVICSIKTKFNTPYDEAKLARDVELFIAAHNAWLAHRNVRASRYEDILTDIRPEVRGVAQLLGVVLADDEVEDYAQQFCLESQRERVASFQQRLHTLVRETDTVSYDPHSMLHANHIGSGQINRWRTELQPWELATIEKVAGPWLKKHGYALSK